MWWESDLMKHFQRKNLLLASLICLQHFNFHGKCFFLKGEIQKFLRLLEISCLQVRNSKLIIIIMLDILQSYMLVVYNYHCRGVFQNIFWCGCCSLLIFVAKKATWVIELQFLCMQAWWPAIIYSRNILHLLNWLHDVFNNWTHFICTSHLLATIVKIVGKANKQWTEDSEMRETVNFTIILW